MPSLQGSRPSQGRRLFLGAASSWDGGAWGSGTSHSRAGGLASPAPAALSTGPATSQSRAAQMSHCQPRAAASVPAALGPLPRRGRSCRSCPGCWREHLAACEGWPEACRAWEPQGLPGSCVSLWAGPRGACASSLSLLAASMAARGQGPSRQPRRPAAGQAQSKVRNRHPWLRHAPSQLHWQLRGLARII